MTKKVTKCKAICKSGRQCVYQVDLNGYCTIHFKVYNKINKKVQAIKSFL